MGKHDEGNHRAFYVEREKDAMIQRRARIAHHDERMDSFRFFVLLVGEIAAATPQRSIAMELPHTRDHTNASRSIYI